MKLTERELDVLSVILYVYYGNRNTDRLTIGKSLFSPKVKASLMNTLNMSKYQFHNVIFKLRKKGLIEGNDLKPAFLTFYPDQNQSGKIVFNIKITAE